jgi:hypothetical protein
MILEPLRLPNLDLQQMYSFVAIQKSQDGDEVLRQLVLHSFLLTERSALQDADAIVNVLRDFFGLEINTERIQEALDYLAARKQIVRNVAGEIDIVPILRGKLNRKVDEANKLQEKVKQQWLAECKALWPDLDETLAWNTLEMYLTDVFKQHGMLTVSLLDPSVQVPPEYEQSMGAILQAALIQCCDAPQRSVIEESVVGFFAQAGMDEDRATFIAQLTDATFSYVSLAVPPAVASQLRAQLKPLTLFLDTNVLFGLIGLDESTRAKPAKEIVELLIKHKLPFRLRYHERTDKELRNTLERVTTSLTSRYWPPSVSRAAASSPKVSTIARLYHRRNGDTSLTAQTFFEPYEHPDVLLGDHEVKLYRDHSSGQEDRIYDLIHEYTSFLKQFGREKPYEAIDHDVRILDCVHRLRSKAPSSLDAEALCLTFDFVLFRFDWGRGRKQGTPPSIILPNIFLQLLRPFLPASSDFDKSFAAAFAFPAFRSVDQKGNAAASKLLEILAAYKDIAEETATALLANNLLLHQLKAAETDEEIHNLVDSAIAAENTALIRDRRALEDELASVRAREEIALADKSHVVTQLEHEVGKLSNQISEARQRSIQAEEALEREKSAVLEQAQRAEAEASSRAEAEKRAIEAEAEAINFQARLQQLEQQAEQDAVERQQRQYRLAVRNESLKGITLGIVTSILIELTVRQLSFTWLLQHPNSYGIRLGTYGMLTAIMIGIFRKPWRSYCWGTAALAMVVTLIQLLGGPRRDSHEQGKLIEESPMRPGMQPSPTRQSLKQDNANTRNSHP